MVRIGFTKDGRLYKSIKGSNGKRSRFVLKLQEEEMQNLARADGFADAAEMMSYLVGRYGPLPICNLNVIQWDYDRPILVEAAAS